MNRFSHSKKSKNTDDIFRTRERTYNHIVLSHSLRKAVSRHSSSNEATLHEAPAIHRARTTSDAYDDDFEIKRTGSGGLFTMKKGFQEKKEISRAKAIHMSALLELSDTRDTELNKNVKLKRKPREITAAPSLRTMSAAQAVQAYAKQEKIAKEEAKNKKIDPLLSEREVKAEKRAEEQKKRKERLKRQNNLQKHRSAVIPKMPLTRRQENILIAISRTSKPNLVDASNVDVPAEESIEVVLPSVSNKYHNQATLHDLPALC